MSWLKYKKTGITKHKPIENNTNGHGCGHNLLGAASLLAATAIKDWLLQNNIKARVRYYGCPAEEGGAAKTYMARDGLFDNVDVAICWHPATFNSVNKPISLANSRIDFNKLENLSEPTLFRRFSMNVQCFIAMS